MISEETIRREPADFPQMVRQLIMVVNSVNMENDPARYKEVVRSLEQTLAGYWDPEYIKAQTALDKAKPIRIEECVDPRTLRKMRDYEKSDLLRKANYNFSIRIEHKRFEELIKLVSRLKMFLEKETEEYII